MLWSGFKLSTQADEETVIGSDPHDNLLMDKNDYSKQAVVRIQFLTVNLGRVWPQQYAMQLG